MIKVEALDSYKKLGLKDENLGYIPQVGEQFDVNEERFIKLTGENEYNTIFVKRVKEKKNKISDVKS